jgi:hypothetical protein
MSLRRQPRLLLRDCRVLQISFGQFLKEAGLIARVAYRPGGVCLNQKRVVFAIMPYLPHFEKIAGGLSLVPQLLPTATVKPDITTRQGSSQGFRIHVCQRKHLAGISILNHGRDKPLLVKSQIAH